MRSSPRRSTRSCGACSCGCCPRIRAGAGGAPTRPAACRRCRAHDEGLAMIEPITDRRTATPISPQLALRVATLGFLALTVFGIIFFRLWYLQVLSGDDYQRQAADNRVRLQTVHATRGY